MTKAAPQAGVRRALDRDQLTLYYQPIHEIESRKIIAAEALLRARRENGEIRNAERIAVGAEEGPELFRLDSWVMQQAISDSRGWKNSVRLHINLSPLEFENGDVMRLRKSLTSNMNLEITETAYVEHPEETLIVLDALKELGVELWLDDFGTGHSSISHLFFPLDGLKLPAEFVSGLPDDVRSHALTKNIIALAHDLDMRVIAEGVENEGQLDALLGMKCDYIQGFLFSEPMPAEELERLI